MKMISPDCAVNAVHLNNVLVGGDCLILVERSDAHDDAHVVVVVDTRLRGRGHLGRI
jgi:hypothetical protein